METGYTLFRFEFMLLLLSFRYLKQKRISVYEFLKFYPARVQSLAGRFSVHFHMQRRTYTNNWLLVGGKILGHFSHSRIICLQSLYGRRRCCTARKQYILVGDGQRQRRSRKTLTVQSWKNWRKQKVLSIFMIG